MTTKPNAVDRTVMEVLEESKHVLLHISKVCEETKGYPVFTSIAPTVKQIIWKAIPIALRQAEAEAELVRYKEALEFLIERLELGIHGFTNEGLAYIKLKRHSSVFGDAIPVKELHPFIRELIEKKGEI